MQLTDGDDRDADLARERFAIKWRRRSLKLLRGVDEGNESGSRWFWIHRAPFLEACNTKLREVEKNPRKPKERQH